MIIFTLATHVLSNRSGTVWVGAYTQEVKIKKQNKTHSLVWNEQVESTQKAKC